jgi:hypothetical protein
MQVGSIAPWPGEPPPARPTVSASPRVRLALHVRLPWRLARAAWLRPCRCQRTRRIGARREARCCPARDRQKRHRESFLLFLLRLARPCRPRPGCAGAGERAPPAGSQSRGRARSPNCQRASTAPHRRPSRADAGHAAESQGRGAPPSATPTKGDEPRAATPCRPSQPQARTQALNSAACSAGRPPPPCGKGRGRRTDRTGQTDRTGRTDRPQPSYLSYPSYRSYAPPGRAPLIGHAQRSSAAAVEAGSSCQAPAWQMPAHRRLGATPVARRGPARNRQKRHRESFLLFRTPPGRCEREPFGCLQACAGRVTEPGRGEPCVRPGPGSKTRHKKRPRKDIGSLFFFFAPSVEMPD